MGRGRIVSDSFRALCEGSRTGRLSRPLFCRQPAQPRFMPLDSRHFSVHTAQPRARVPVSDLAFRQRGDACAAVALAKAQANPVSSFSRDYATPQRRCGAQQLSEHYPPAAYVLAEQRPATRRRQTHQRPHTFRDSTAIWIHGLVTRLRHARRRRTRRYRHCLRNTAFL